MLIVSPLAKVSQLADIEDSVYGSRIIIEDGAAIDSFVKIKPAGGKGDVRIGRNSFVNSGTVIYTGNGVEIGANVLIAANCTFAPVNHEYRAKDTLIRDQGFQPSRGGIVIEDDVWIGANTVILDGAVIRQGAVVGAGSLVRDELAPYSVNRGVPAVEVGQRE
jgi:acetyltransferase-like isoleucine patch superfamily enzyme